jgi:hypothetical protein
MKWAWAAAWTRATVVPAGRRATPVWLGVAIVAGVLFGRNAMQPHDLTHAALGAPALAVGLAIAWLLLIAPVGRALFRSPGSDYLRALPAPRGARWAIAAIAAVIAQAPWVLLWTLGEGAAAGAVAAAGAAIVTLVVGAAPGIAPRGRVPAWRGRVRAAIGVHARGLVRTAGASLVRGAGLALLAGLAGGGIVRANALTGGDAVTYTAAITAALVAIGLAGSIAAVADGERRLDWLARATGLGAARGAATAAVLGGVGAMLGAIAGATAAMGASDVITAVELAAACTGVGLGLGLAGARIATFAAAGAELEAARVVAGAAAAGVAAVGAIGALGPAALAIIVAGGAGLAAANADAIARAARIER